MTSWKTRHYKGELEVDYTRGVIYFHLHDPLIVKKLNMVTLLRVKTHRPLEEGNFIDIYEHKI